EVTVIAGRLAGLTPPPPPPKSWASRPDTDVAIWLLKMAPGARFALPPAARGTNRTLYFFRGGSLRAGDRAIPPYHRVELRPDAGRAGAEGAGRRRPPSRGGGAGGGAGGEVRSVR